MKKIETSAVNHVYTTIIKREICYKVVKGKNGLVEAIIEFCSVSVTVYAQILILIVVGTVRSLSACASFIVEPLMVRLEMVLEVEVGICKFPISL